MKKEENKSEEAQVAPTVLTVGMATAIVELLKRTQLSGNEVGGYVEIINTLTSIIKNG